MGTVAFCASGSCRKRIAMAQVYGTVISTFDSPSTQKFAFVLNKDMVVHKGQFVQLDVIDGKLVGRIADVFKTNRYFNRPESVNEVGNSGSDLDEHYPVWEHEYLVAEAAPLGVYTGNGFKESTFPPSPGAKVGTPDLDVLTKFLGIDHNGLHVGKLMYHDVDVKLNLTKLLQKHLAILAISGAGKSYLTSVLMEELINRPDDRGKLATIIIDPHGEYSSFSGDAGFAGKVRVFKGSEIKIGVPNLSAYRIGTFAPELSSSVQMRELNRVIREMDGSYGISDLIDYIDKDERIKTTTKDVLITLLENLRYTGLFGASDYPSLDDLVRQGEMSVIDLSEEVNLRKKQIIASYLANKLFDYRRNGVIPPFLFVVEEAHQFAPEKSSKTNAISKGIIETIAREGRKFHAALCLISQRPVQLSTTALSQCNTHFILKVTNPYDLKHIEESSEGMNRSVIRQISGLRVGTGIVVGEAVNFPIFVEIRNRKSKSSGKGSSLEEAAIEYKKKLGKKKEDTKAFM